MKKFSPFALFLTMGGIFLLLGGGKFLTPEGLSGSLGALDHFVSIHPVFSFLLFFVIYFVVAVSLLPGLLLLDLIAGFLFPQPYGFCVIMASAALASTTLFYAARYAFSRRIPKEEKRWVEKIKQGFHKYQEGYLIFLRLIPLFPFGAVSIALGATRIKFWKYLWTTLLGLTPSILVFTIFGQQLHHLLEDGFSMKSLFTPTVLFVYGCVALGTLVLTLLLYRYRQRQVIPKDSSKDSD